MRKRIYYLLTNTASIRPTSGDCITEIGIMKALSENYDIYYNDVLFKPNEPGYGINESSINLPSRKYDLHIVRNNPTIFKKIEGRKVYFASPYDKECFNQADKLYTFTNSWTSKISEGYNFPYNIYPDGFKTDDVITLTQVVDESFFAEKSEYMIRKMRLKMGGGFIIGHFGRIAKSCYPSSFLSILPEIRAEYKNVNIVFGGNSSKIKDIGSKNNIRVLNFAYDEMPIAIAACDLILYNYKDGQGHIAGSMKILEAMASGVPILCPKYDARIDELGYDYPLFHPCEDLCKTNAEPTSDRFSLESEKIMKDLIKTSILDDEFRRGIGRKIKKRAEFYNPDNSAIRFKKTIDEVLK
jgi:glycosyltransferase involved in cell wall biosynthesis